MPKNKGKGGKNPRRGKNENPARKQLEEDKEYVRVTKMLGYDKLKAVCFDGLKLLCQIPDELQDVQPDELEEEPLIKKGDIILVFHIDRQNAKADVFRKMTDTTIEQNKTYEEFPPIRLNRRFNFLKDDELDDDDFDFRD